MVLSMISLAAYKGNEAKVTCSRASNHSVPTADCGLTHLIVRFLQGLGEQPETRSATGLLNGAGTPAKRSTRSTIPFSPKSGSNIRVGVKRNQPMASRGMGNPFRAAVGPRMYAMAEQLQRRIERAGLRLGGGSRAVRPSVYSARPQITMQFVFVVKVIHLIDKLKL